MRSRSDIRKRIDRMLRCQVFELGIVFLLVLAISIAIGTGSITGNEVISSELVDLTDDVAKKLGLEPGSRLNIRVHSNCYPDDLTPMVLVSDGVLQCGGKTWKIGTSEAASTLKILEDGQLLPSGVPTSRVEVYFSMIFRKVFLRYTFWILTAIVAARWGPKLVRTINARNAIAKFSTSCLGCGYEVDRRKRCPECGRSPRDRIPLLIAKLRAVK